MCKRNRKLMLAASLVLAGLAGAAQAQISITGTGTFNYTQDFNTLPQAAGTNWANNSTIAGWSVFNSNTNSGSGNTGGRDSATFTAFTGAILVGAGTASNAGVWSWGSSGATVGDRTLGAMNSNTLGDFYYGVQFINNTDQTISSITVGYTGEQWRRELTSTSVQDLHFEYAVNAPSFESDTGFTSVPSLTFVAPQLAAGAALIGNDAANRQVFAPVNLSVSLLPGQVLTLRWFENNEAGNETGQGIDDFNFSASISGVTPSNLTWNPGTTEWSTGAVQNWLNGATPASFNNGDIVTFGDTGVGAVAIAAGGVNPGSTTVANNAGVYTFAGGSIGGSGTLTKTGAGTLILSSANTFAGGVSISGGGIVEAASDAALGAAGTNIAVDNGTLRAGGALTTTRAITVGFGGATLDTNGNDATFTSLSSTGALVKQGAGKLTFTGAVSNSGSTSIAGGSLVLAQASGTVTIVSPGTNAFAGNLDIAGAIRVNINGGPIEGGGQIRFVANNATIGHAGASVTVIHNNNIVLNPDGLAQPFNAAITANGGNTAEINGVISGAGNLTFGNLASDGGQGIIKLNAAATYTGATVINNGYQVGLTGSYGAVQLGTNDALPTGTAVTFGLANANAGAIDLAGFNQTIASLASAGTGTYLGISNSGASLSTLTINGSASTTYSGPIGKALTSDLAGLSNDNIKLVRAGAGSIKFTGANTYAAGTDINGGTLIVANAFTDLDGKSGTGTGAVNVNAGGKLAGSGRIAGNVAVTGGTVAPGESGGSLLLASGVNFAAGGSYEWGLSALSTANPGVNFDQIVVSAGDVVLGGTSNFSIVFDGTATNPDAGNSFWNSARSWKVLDNAGAGTTTGIFTTVLGGDFLIGDFSLRAGIGANVGDVFLDYTPLIPGPKNLVWNGGGSLTGPSDADGSWSAAGAWWDDNTASGTTFSSVTPDNARFGAGTGGAGTVTVSIPTAVTAGEVVFAANSPNYTISGGTLTLAGTSATDLTSDNSATIDSNVVLGGPQSWTVNGANVLTINGAISGGQTISKAGTGTLVLTNAGNSFVSITLEAGTLSPANDGALGGAGAAVTLNGGTFKPTAALTSSRAFILAASGTAFDTSTGDTTLTGVVSGGVLTKSGAGVLALENAGNSFASLTVSGTNSLVRPTSESALGFGSTIVLSNGGGLQLPDGFTVTRTLDLQVVGAGGVIDVPTGNATLSGVVTGELLTTTGAGRLLVNTPTPSTRTKNVDIKGGTLALAVVDGATGVGPLGTGGHVASVAGTLEVTNVKLGYKTDGSRGTNFVANINEGGTLSGTGSNAAITGTIGFAGTSGMLAAGVSDRLLIGSTVRNSSTSGQFPGTITVSGAGQVRLASGGTSASATTQYNGAWVVNMDQATGILSVGPVEPAGFGETLNALGYSSGEQRGAGRPITVTSGTLAIGSDTWNNGASSTTLTNMVSVRSPITLDGGKIASTGFSIDNAATTTTSGAVFSTTPVAAKLAGDITVVGGKTSTVLLYDPVSNAGPRDVHIMTDALAINVAGNLAWSGTLELEPGSTPGGALIISRDVAATSGFVSVDPGAQITIKSGAALKLSGPGSTLTDGFDHVNIVNNANAAGEGLTVLAGSQRVGAISGSGRVTASGTLIATSIRQDVLEIGATAQVAIAPDGATTGASKVGSLSIAGASDAWTGKLDLNDNSLVIAAGGAALTDVLNQVKQGRAAGAWNGQGITSAAAAGDLRKITGLGAIRNSDEAAVPAPLKSDLDGQAAALDDILVKYTYSGDSDLSGVVDASDYFQIDAGFLSGGSKTGWRWGDYDYSGTVDVDDYFLIDVAYSLQSGPLSIAAPNAVPEPGTLALLALGAAALLGRRRRR